MADEAQEAQPETGESVSDVDAGLEPPLEDGTAGGDDDMSPSQDDGPVEPGPDAVDSPDTAQTPQTEEMEPVAVSDAEVVKEIEQTEEQIDEFRTRIEDVRNFVSEKLEAGILTEEEKDKLDAMSAELMDGMNKLDLLSAKLNEMVAASRVEEQVEHVAEHEEEHEEEHAVEHAEEHAEEHSEPDKKEEDGEDEEPPAPAAEAPKEPPPPIRAPRPLVPATPSSVTSMARLAERLPRVIVTGLGGEDGPPGIVCLPRPVKNLDAGRAVHLEGQVQKLSGELGVCYSVQEKLAADNEHLEKLRSQLVETVVQKDTEVEQLEKNLHRLQKEIRLISSENTKLNEQLTALQAQVEKERDEHTEMRQFFGDTTPSICTPATCPALLQGRATGLPRTSRGGQDQGVTELGEKFRQLQHDLSVKVKEVSELRAEAELLKGELVRLHADKEETEGSLAAAQGRLRRLETQLLQEQGTRRQLREREAELGRARHELQQAHFDGRDLRAELQEQTSLCAQYRDKYLASEQMVQSLCRQQETSKADLVRHAAALNDDIQRIRTECQERLQSLANLPQLVSVLQLKVREANQARLLAEASCEEMRRKFEEVAARAEEHQHQVEVASSDTQLGQDHRAALQVRFDTVDARCQVLRRENTVLRDKLESMELELDKARTALEERDHQALQLRQQLQMVYEGCARSAGHA